MLSRGGTFHSTRPMMLLGGGHSISDCFQRLEVRNARSTAHKSQLGDGRLIYELADLREYLLKFAVARCVSFTSRESCRKIQPQVRCTCAPPCLSGRYNR